MRMFVFGGCWIYNSCGKDWCNDEAIVYIAETRLQFQGYCAKHITKRDKCKPRFNSLDDVKLHIAMREL